jgi:hypothetical protein
VRAARAGGIGLTVAWLGKEARTCQYLIWTNKAFLPQGVHECTVEEISERFAQFQESDRRIRLFAKLQSFIAEARKTRFVVELIIDGSYVTAKPKPNDVDLIVVLAMAHDFSADLRPFEYKIVSKRRVRETYRFDILVAVEGSRACAEYTEFFQQIRGQPERRKGILRVKL